MDENRLVTYSGRRDFAAKLAALVLGAVACLVPLVTCVLTALAPLRKKSRAQGMVRVTSLEALPNDGLPRKFNIVADRVDAWNTYRDIPVGSIYLRRTGDQQVTALNVVCPHAGCAVDFDQAKGQFHCPCHGSSFAIDGSLASATSLSPRPMDALEVEIRSRTEVWVRFRNFQTGGAEKIPLS